MGLLVFVIAMAIVAFVAARTVAGRVRRRALEEPLPDDALALLARRVPLYRALPAALKPALHRALREFLHDKRFVGCDGLEITDEMRLVIAAQACLLVCAREPARYTGFTSVLVYPDAFVVDRIEHDGAIEIVSEEARAGESWADGPVILSWRDVEAGLAVPDDGYNVVLHEFAHKIDMRNGSANGFPPLHAGMDRKAWSAVFGAAFADFERRLDAREETLLDEYAAEDPAEFFAVTSELFFERPAALHELYPAVYDQLAQFYRQNPLARIRPPGSRASA